MIGRCTNPRATGAGRYHGRGISVCNRWRFGDGEHDGFACFLKDMGERPGIALTLDRYPDQDGNYEPGNVRWATPREQGNNRFTNRLIEFGGEMLSVAEVARRTGLRDSTLRERLRRGWDVEKAISALP